MTNFEKICNGTAEDLAGIAKPISCDYCLEEYDTSCTYKNCRDEFVKWLNSPAPIELTQTEREICVGLKHLGYNYLVREPDTKIYAYHDCPTKLKERWIGSRCLRVDFDLSGVFNPVKWEDEEPTSIDELLEG